MAQYVHKVNGLDIAASAAVPGSPLAQALDAISGGAFRIVPLTGQPGDTGRVPDPEGAVPPVPLSEKIIYLTKDESSTATDPYTEWIWIKGDETTDPPTADKWEIIGTTSLSLEELHANEISDDGVNFQVRVVESEGKITEVHVDDDSTETTDNKITAWGTPTDDQYPSAKLVNDTKADKVTVGAGEDPSGHVPELDSEGNLVDSEIVADDVVTDVIIPATEQGEEDIHLVTDHVASIPKAIPSSASTSSTTVNSEWGVVTIATIDL